MAAPTYSAQELARIIAQEDYSVNLHTSGIDAAELAELLAGKKAAQSKYHNRITEVDGITFDSQKEAREYQSLKLLELAGQITDLRLQPKYQLRAGYRDNQGKRIRPIYYVADFEYREGDQLITVDVKGLRTKEYRIKAKLFKALYPEHKFVER